MVQHPAAGPEVDNSEEGQLLARPFPLCSQLPDREPILPSRVSSTAWLISAKPTRDLVGVLSHFSRVQLFVTPWTVARQAPLSTCFSRKEYWSGLPCLHPGDRRGEPVPLMSPALAGWFFTTVPPGKPAGDLEGVKITQGNIEGNQQYPCRGSMEVRGSSGLHVTFTLCSHCSLQACAQSVLRGCLMERSGSTPTPFIRISGVQPTGYTDNLLTLGALGQGKPETQSHQCPRLTGSGMLTHSSHRQRPELKCQYLHLQLVCCLTSTSSPRGPVIQESRAVECR